MGDHVPLIGKQIAKSRLRDGFLFVQAGEHLLDDNAGQGFGLRCFNMAAARHVQHAQKSEQLRLCICASAYPPKMRVPLSPVGSTDALEKSRCGIRRFVEQDAIDIADINAEFECARGDAKGVFAAAKSVFYGAARAGLQVGVVEVGNALKRALTRQKRKQPITTPPAVGKQQNFAIPVGFVEIV